MRIERFQHLVDLHGGGIERWPASEQAAALKLASAVPHAARILAEARTLDHMLDASRPRVDDAAVERVLATIAARVDPVTTRNASFIPATWPRAAWPAAGFLAAMGLLGVLSGSLGVLETPLHGEASLATLVTSTPYMIAWGQ